MLFVFDVTDNASVLKQGDAWADVRGMVQVVAGHEDGGAGLFVVGFQQMLDGGLGTGVKEIERFIKDEQAGLVEHGRNDSYFLFVAHGEIPDIFFLAQYFAVHEACEGL